MREWDVRKEIREKALGPEHRETAGTLRNLGEFYARRGLYVQADPYLRRAFLIAEKLPEAGRPSITDFAKSYLNVL